MRTRTLAAIALGGAALFAVPAGVAYAVSGPTDTAFAHARLGGNGNGTNAQGNAQGNANAGQQGKGATASIAGHGQAQSKGAGGSPQGGHGAAGWVGDPASLVTPGSTASASDAASLAFMIEEEKVAHDLYVALGDAWDLAVFSNIASAEATHTDAVRSLVDAYGLDDPTEGLGAGEFNDPSLQDLYDTLLEMGLTSRNDALVVGGLVEETDILDLRERANSSPAIDQVFDRLESGSESHLRAFVTTLERAGIDYDPQVLSDADVARILGQ